LLKIILQNTKTIQLFIIVVNRKYLQTLLKMPSWMLWVLGLSGLFKREMGKVQGLRMRLKQGILKEEVSLYG
jgi:hypothetical protein